MARGLSALIEAVNEMRILHIFDHSIPLHSGYTFRSKAILQEQRKLGWETAHITSAKHTIEMMALNKEVPSEEDVDGFHFYRTSISKGVLSQLSMFNQLLVISSLIKRLSEVVRLVQPDILHAHSPALNGIAALRTAKKFGLPLVYEVRAFWEDAAVDHGSCREGDVRYRSTHALETYVLRRADAVACICEGLRGDIVARGISSDKVTVIPNAVDIEKFQLGAMPDKELAVSLGLDGKIVLGFIGSFYAYEGISLLLEVLPELVAVRPDVRVLLVGGGNEEQALRRQANQLGMEDKIIFTGRVSHDRIRDYYNLVDIFVYPRVSIRLTNLVTPLKPLEAMAQGRLVVASDVGGHCELISNGKTGWLFRAGDAQNLADTLLQLLSARQQWPAIRATARHFVEQKRNWPMSVANYQPLYDSIVSARRDV